MHVDHVQQVVCMFAHYFQSNYGIARGENEAVFLVLHDIPTLNWLSSIIVPQTSTVRPMYLSSVRVPSSQLKRWTLLKAVKDVANQKLETAMYALVNCLFIYLSTYLVDPRSLHSTVFVKVVNTSAVGNLESVDPFGRRSSLTLVFTIIPNLAEHKTQVNLSKLLVSFFFINQKNCRLILWSRTWAIVTAEFDYNKKGYLLDSFPCLENDAWYWDFFC